MTKNSIILLFIVSIISLTNYSYAVDVDTKSSLLSGNELLCELSITGPTQERPGIYYLKSETQKLKCLIPFGKDPQWSPDHKKILYLYQGADWIFDLKLKSYYKVADKYSMAVPDDTQIIWTPDSKAIVYKISTYKFGEMPIITVLAMGGKTGPLWDRDFTERVGRISFSPYGQFAAYESLLNLPTMSIESQQSTICIAEISHKTENGSKVFTKILDERIKNCSCLNPKWQPKGTKIAFESFLPETKERKIWLFDTADKSIKEMVVNGRVFSLSGRKILGDDNLLLLGWSPDGNTLLTVPQDDYPTSTYIYVVPLDEKLPVKSLAGMLSMLFDTTYSPDGKYVACLRGNGEKLDRCREMYFLLYNLEKDEGNRPTEIEIPKNLIPVRLNW